MYCRSNTYRTPTKRFVCRVYTYLPTAVRCYIHIYTTIYRFHPSTSMYLFLFIYTCTSSFLMLLYPPSLSLLLCCPWFAAPSSCNAIYIFNLLIYLIPASHVVLCIYISIYVSNDWVPWLVVTEIHSYVHLTSCILISWCRSTRWMH